MSLEFLYLIVGLVLLWTPRSVLRLGKPRKTRTRRSSLKKSDGSMQNRLFGDHSVWVSEEFAHLRNWLDFGRALGGGLAVMSLLPMLLEQAIGVEWASPKMVTFGVQAVILAAAVVIQMIRVEERLVLFAPIFFVLGLSFAIVGWKAAAIGFVAIWALNLVIPNPAVFMGAYGLMMVVLSVFLGADLKFAGLIAALSMGPPLIAALSGRRLAKIRKRSRMAMSS